MSKFDVPFEEAEAMKLGGVRLNESKTEEIERIVNGIASKWIREIKRALDFVANTYPRDAIEKIFLSGGSCSILGFQRDLEEETNIPVTELNPFRFINIDSGLFDTNYLRYMGPQAGVAMGLALRSIGDK